MADQKGEGGSYLVVWGVMFKEPWKHLLHEVANLSAEDAGRASIVLGSDRLEDPPVSEPQQPVAPASAPPFRRRVMPAPPTPGADP